MTGGPFIGVTVQLWVGDIGDAAEWCSRLFDREPDFQPHDDFVEYEFSPDHWLQIVERDPAGVQQSPVRFGVPDIRPARDRLLDRGIDVDEIKTLAGAAHWCGFRDPWGNRLGLFQDLAGSA